MADQKNFYGYIRVSYKGLPYNEQKNRIINAYNFFKEKYNNYDCVMHSISTNSIYKKENISIYDYVDNFSKENNYLITASFDRIALNSEDLCLTLKYLKDNKVNLHVININFSSEESGYENLIVLISELENFRKQILKELQHVGIEKAKLEGKYPGRKPTARMKKPEVLELMKTGDYTNEEIAVKVGIGISSVLRIKEDIKADIKNSET